MEKNNDITQLIDRWQSGDEAALESLTPLIYDELKRLARGYMHKERHNHTLQATALVNEAFLRLAGSKADYQSRAHFLVTAARMMRRALVDHSRAKASLKRGGNVEKVELHEDAVSDEAIKEDIIELDEALTRMAESEQQLAQTVELIFFGGLTYDETAKYLNRSRSSIYDDLQFAKAWLRREMS